MILNFADDMFLLSESREGLQNALMIFRSIVKNRELL